MLRNILVNAETLGELYLEAAQGVLHLGAHIGQEAAKYYAMNKPVIWFEANPVIFGKLIENIREYANQSAYCVLLGDVDGRQCDFHISNNSNGASSSIYRFGPYAQGEKSLWPDLRLAMIDKLSLTMLRLDTFVEANDLDLSGYDYWVIDLQGAELLALQGSLESLANCKVILIEVSTVEVYEKGARWNDLLDWLDNAGFSPVKKPKKEHEDILFVRSDSLARAKHPFRTDEYQRHNQRRLEHLATLGLPLAHRKVLELGAGIGDHTHFYLDRGCKVVASDVRLGVLSVLCQRYANHPGVTIFRMDLNYPIDLNESFDVIHCYGLLYHLDNPYDAIDFIARHVHGFALFETCFSTRCENDINVVDEPSENVTQAYHGRGCRPGKAWLIKALRNFFPYVYETVTLPNHEEFALSANEQEGKLTRIVLVASKLSMENYPGLSAVAN